MRTAKLKIDGVEKEGILIAGGPGFKIYSVSGFDGWVLKVGRKTSLVNVGTDDFQIISDYVNIRYQSSKEHEQIKKDFSDLVDKYIH